MKKIRSYSKQNTMARWIEQKEANDESYRTGSALPKEFKKLRNYSGMEAVRKQEKLGKISRTKAYLSYISKERIIFSNKEEKRTFPHSSIRHMFFAVGICEHQEGEEKFRRSTAAPRMPLHACQARTPHGQSGGATGSLSRTQNAPQLRGWGNGGIDTEATAEGPAGG